MSGALVFACVLQFEGGMVGTDSPRRAIAAPPGVLSAAMRGALDRARAEAAAWQRSLPGSAEANRERLRDLARQEWATLSHERFPHVSRGNTTHKWVALTFDDGPNPVWTPRVLDALRQARVHATFFLVGRHAEQYPELVRRIAAEGHAIGDHTEDHLYLTRISPVSARAELEACSEVLAAITGRRPRFYRPPGGHYDEEVVRIGRELGMLLIGWTDSIGDFAEPRPAWLLHRALGELRPGGIMIWHDTIPETPAVLPEFIREARRRGYEFVPLETFARPAQNQK